MVRQRYKFATFIDAHKRSMTEGLEYLLSLDERLFLWINGFQSSWMDSFIPLYRHKLFWAPLYIFILTFLIWNFPRNGLWMILFIVLTIGFSDTISSQWIKKNVERLRPCNQPELKDEVISRIRCGGGYSFTSSHATNHAALASFLIFLLHGRKKWWGVLLALWAVTIGLSQVYVGVHYPLDILGGLFVGSLVGWLLAWLFHRRWQLE